MEALQSKTRTLWRIDPVHSFIGFKVKHLMLANIRGVFEEYTDSITTKGEDFTSAEVEISIIVASINTREADRDFHLKGPDFFDAENFKELTFKSTYNERKFDNDFVLHGDMTIKGITKPVALEVEFNGVIDDPFGKIRAGFEIRGKISRKEFGLTWNNVSPTGGVMIADEIALICEIEATQQPQSE
jgi:polyisoprenoid-binding protein YceI